MVGATAVAGEAAFLALHNVAGVDLAVHTGDTVDHVGPVAVGATCIVVALAGWGLLALLERFTARSRLIWTIIAAAVFVVSLLGPAGGVDASATLGLVALHLIVAAVLVVGLPWAGRRARR